MPLLRVMVHLAAAPPPQVAERVAALTAAGMVVGRVNVMFGIVHGTAPAAVLPVLRAMPGVTYVADETCLWDRALFPKDH